MVAINNGSKDSEDSELIRLYDTFSAEGNLVAAAAAAIASYDDYAVGTVNEFMPVADDLKNLKNIADDFKETAPAAAALIDVLIEGADPQVLDDFAPEKIEEARTSIIASLNAISYRNFDGLTPETVAKIKVIASTLIQSFSDQATIPSPAHAPSVDQTTDGNQGAQNPAQEQPTDAGQDTDSAEVHAKIFGKPDKISKLLARTQALAESMRDGLKVANSVLKTLSVKPSMWRANLPDMLSKGIDALDKGKTLKAKRQFDSAQNLAKKACAKDEQFRQC